MAFTVDLTCTFLIFTLKVMEVHISPNREAQLCDLAAKTGRGTDDLVQEAIDRLFADNQWFKDQVQVGIDQLDRGEFIEEDEMDARVDRMLRS
jgi:predicted transcriptional regulator